MHGGVQRALQEHIMVNARLHKRLEVVCLRRPRQEKIWVRAYWKKIEGITIGKIDLAGGKGEEDGEGENELNTGTQR